MSDKPVVSDKVSKGASVANPADVSLWLEWAGGRLLAMPGARGHTQVRALWPDYSQDTFQVLDFRARLPARIAAPAASEIAFVDEILLLPNLCSDVRTRRVLHARALVHPLSRRHIFSYAKLALALHTSRQSALNRHRAGLREVCEKASAQQMLRFSAFFHDSVLRA